MRRKIYFSPSFPGGFSHLTSDSLIEYYTAVDTTMRQAAIVPRCLLALVYIYFSFCASSTYTTRGELARERKTLHASGRWLI